MKRNVRIAIRDTTDTHVVGFFDNKSGIKYNAANLTQFLKGSCSVLVLTYHSKKMVAQSGQKLAFRFKDKDFWLNINSVKKAGYNIELTAYSLSLEANKEKRGPHKPASAMTIKQYIEYYDPENSFVIGINEVADKSLKLEWSGTDTILARLYSVANGFGAELEFVTELNNDYSLKRHVINIYREGNFGKDKTGMPVRVGEKLKVINYSDNMDDFYTGIRRTGKDGLTIGGLNKKIYDDKGNLLFYSSGDTLYAPQARDKYPSIARKTNDGYIVNEDSGTEYANKEALFGYMLSELKKHCELKVDYEVEGAVDGNIGDKKTLIDAQHFDPPLYVQARISEQTESLLEASDVKTSLSNYVRKSNQIANELLQKVEQLALEATPYTIKLATNNGIIFKNNQGQSIVYPTLKKGNKRVECTWQWLVDNQSFGTSATFEVRAAGMSSKLVLTAIALVDEKEVAREQVTFSNVNDGAKGDPGKSITITKTERQADGVKVTFSDNKSIVVPKGDKGDPADPKELNQLKQEMNQARQGLDDVKADLLREKSESSAKIDQVKQDVGAIRNQQTTYEQTNTQNLARITGQLGDKASKSEVKQTADGIREEISHLSTASRNYILNSDMTTSTDRTTGTGLPLSSDLIRTLNAERSFTLSVDVVAQNMVAKNDKKRFGISYELKFSDGSNLWTEVFQTSDTALTRISQNFVLPAGKQIVSIAGGLYFQATGQIKLSRPKWGIGHNNKEWIKAVEDTDEQITAARTTFEKTAEGLKTDMAAVKSYVADDGKRREQLEQYTRTETARSAEALRKQASESYVAKSQYSEDARGVARRFEELNLNGTNLLPNTDFKNLVDVGNQFTVGGKTYKVKTLDKWYSSYNDGIPNPKTNYHGYFNETKFSETVFEFNESNGVREWKGLPIFITNDSRYTVGKYIFSVDVNATGLGTHLEVGFYYYNKAGMREFHAGRSRKNITSINAWSRISLELNINDDVDFSKEMGFYIYGYGFTSNSVLYFKRPKLTNTNWTPSVEDNKKYAETKIAEYKQTVDGQLAAVKQDVNGKVSQATFEQRANQITQTVQELNDNVVKKNQIRVNENGIVSTAEKVVNGQTLASMIAQHPEWVEIIAKLLKVKADMIVNGAITADKLNVKELSALASDLGKITAGEIEFTARFRNSPSHDTWGTVPGEYNYDATVLINSSGIYSNGKIGRENKEDKTPTITPVSYFKNGELFFANLEAGHSLKYMEMNGIHPFVRGGSSLMYFGKKEDGKDALYITCRNAELYLKSDNYTDWKQSEVNNKVRWKVQGSLVLVDFNLQFDRDGDYHLADIPKQYVPSNKMFPVQAWSLDRNKDRTAQLNVGGDLHIIGAERGIPYLGQIIWTY
ncbi:hypothetical protein [Streptococcus intermedius]|uniref:hypothetical protein n=1 Tax=Streptococcus intermedius TaxID=1338 RepID=UPI0013C2E9BF|nr:hypothetical protein [Streptococcus intermedius]